MMTPGLFNSSRTLTLMPKLMCEENDRNARQINNKRNVVVNRPDCPGVIVNVAVESYEQYIHQREQWELRYPNKYKDSVQ